MKTVKNGEPINALNISISKFHRLKSAQNGQREATEKPRIQSLDENSVNVLENAFFVLEWLRIDMCMYGIPNSKVYIRGIPYSIIVVRQMT